MWVWRTFGNFCLVERECSFLNDKLKKFRNHDKVQNLIKFLKRVKCKFFFSGWLS